MVDIVEHLGLFAPLPKDLADQFPPLSQDSSPPHVTILYLGEVPSADIPRVEAALRPVLAAFHGPITATLKSLDYFRNPQEGTSVAHMGVSFSKDVESLRAQCLRALSEVGLEFPQKYPWYNPHVTLKYQEGLWDLYTGPMPQGQWELRDMELWGSKPLANLGLKVAAASKFKSKKKVKTQDGGTAVVYEYSERQVQHRNREKANRLEKLRGLRKDLVKKVKKDYGSDDLKTRLSALAVGLIDLTFERVGNDESAKEGHFGVTGWQVRHFKFSGSKLTISYVGKSGVSQTKEVTDGRAISLLKALVKGKKPGDKVLSDEGVSISSSDVNAYLPEGLTAKDLRGLHANEEMRAALKRHRKGALPSEKKDREKKLKEEFAAALEETAAKVGHEPATLKGQYLVPGLEDAFLQDGKILSKLNKVAFSIPGVRMLPGADSGHLELFGMRGSFSAFDTLRKASSPLRDALLGSGEWTPASAASVLQEACERCRGVLASHYGAPEGFEFGSEAYWKVGSTCGLCQHVPRVLRATKSQSEKEDEGASEILKGEPKKKPPRRDLRNNRTYDRDVDDDADLKGRGAEGDRDLSLNYKRVASDKARTEEGAKTQFEAYKKENPETKKTWEDFFEKPEDGSKPEEKDPPPSDAEISKSLKSFGKSTGMELDAEIQTALREALGNLSPKAGKAMLQEITKDLKSLDLPSLSREAADEAREELNSLSESLEGTTSPAAVVEQVVHAIHAQRILEEFEIVNDPEKSAERLQKSVQKAFGVSEVSESVAKKLKSMSQGLDPDDLKGFLAEIKQAQSEIADALKKNDQGETHFPPGFLEKATAAMDSDSFKEGASLREKAHNIALSIAAASAIADPFNLGGSPISADSKSSEELAARGLQSYEKYQGLSSGLRMEAAEKIAKRLEEVSEESPEHAELNRVLDGIALAEVAAMKPGSDPPKIPGREMTPAFASMAQKMAQAGDASVLLGSVEDYVSNRGQLAVQRALEGLDDRTLSEVAKEEMPELSGLLADIKDTDREKVALVRQAVIDAQVDSLSLIDQLVSERMKASGAKDWEDSKVRARIAKKALSLSPKKALANLLSWAKSPNSDDTALFRTASDLSLDIQVRMERLLSVHEQLKAQYGESESHYDQILALFLKTKDPRYLRADPDPREKNEKLARFSVDTFSVITAGSSESCNWTSILTDRGPNMTISKEATQAFETLSIMLDKVASHITTNYALMDIPKEAAHNFAMQCDALSDHADKNLGVLADRKVAAVTGDGQGKSVGDDGNMTLDTDGFDASSVAELKDGPVRSDADEEYMKINFLQKEFHELRNFQESGMLDNVKEASAILRHFSDRFVLQAAALEAQAKKNA